MMNSWIRLVLSCAVATIFVLLLTQPREREVHRRKLNTFAPDGMRQLEIQQKLEKRALGYAKFDQPDEFARFHREIRTKPGAANPDYPANYRIIELDKAVKQKFGVPLSKMTSSVLQASNVLPWVERGPGNVSGRTRGIIIDPTDASGNTWFAGSVGGGIWKTTNAGQTWTNKTPTLPNLATTTLALAASNPDVLYAGTGEGFFNVDAINGDGMFKSTDHGETWTQLGSTANNTNFDNINRILVDPANENVVIVCANTGFYQATAATGIFKSTDGGTTWTSAYTASSGRVQHLVANPQDFNILYATHNPVSVLKSTDKGNTWSSSSTGLVTGARVELAVAASDPSRLYAAVENGTNSDLYVSTDAGSSWTFMQDIDNLNDNWLGSQGWYDNAIAVHPYSPDTLFVGGINLWKITMQPGSGTRPITIAGVQNTSSFLAFVNWGGPYLGGGAGRGTNFYGTTTTPLNTSESDYVSVEIRFGSGLSQKAHRFVGGASFIYPYRDYVTVPFQVWDVTAIPPRQLMASFRDSSTGQPGVFDLIAFNSSNPQREYMFVHAIPYNDAAPDPNITVSGGERYKNIYAIWPILATGGTWTPGSLPTSHVYFTYQVASTKMKNTQMLTNWFPNLSSPTHPSGFYPYVHADQHNLLMIPKNQSTNAFTIVNANDGGMSISTDGGLNWSQIVGYNTTQFYGADKKPGANEYVGGMQDNGTWRSPVDPGTTSQWINQLGGDGFEVSWHYNNPLWIVGSIQSNNIRKTTDGGQTWRPANTGITGSSSFITKVAKTNSDPDLLFTVSGNGVFRSDNFADNWTGTSIITNWAFSSSFTEVDIADANPQVVWAGSRMDGTGRIFVSKDGGLTFTQSNNYSAKTMGRISGFSTHPTNDSVGFALFSLAQLPKILKTTDYGQSWTDLTGFSGTTSSNGFPDVATYSLLVMPYNTDILWAGTEIGLFESTNGGGTWSFSAGGFPAVAVWDMKIVNNQIVVGTHGRGIWSVELPELANYQPPAAVLVPRVNWVAQDPQGNVNISLSLRQAYDSTIVFINNTRFAVVNNAIPKDTMISYPVSLAGTVSSYLTSYVTQKQYKSPTKSTAVVAPRAAQASYSNNFNVSTTDLSGSGFSVATPANFTNGAIHSTHFYANNANYTYQLAVPIVVASSGALMRYDDIALVEPGEPGSVFGSSDFYDYVVVEGSSNGFNWIPLADGYDATYDAAWLSAFNGSQSGTPALFRTHTINLLNTFAAGTTIFIRFRLFADGSVTGWGWAVDNLEIQSPAVSVGDGFSQLPTTFELQQNFPNPFNPSTTIRFSLPTTSKVSLRIFDQLGRAVETLVDKNLEAGYYEETWKARAFASGVYFIRLEAQGYVETRKILLLK